MLEIKIMKGKIFTIKLGMKIEVRINGVIKFTFRFLKNSTSSKRFKIKPKQKDIKIALNKILK